MALLSSQAVALLLLPAAPAEQCVSGPVIFTDQGWEYDQDQVFEGGPHHRLVPVPEVFSCRGAHFDPAWSEYHDSILKFGHESEGTYLKAISILEKWMGTWMETYQYFFDLLVPNKKRAQEGDHFFTLAAGLDAQERAKLLPALNGLCVYGLVSSLFTMAFPDVVLVGGKADVGGYAMDRAWLLMGKELEYDFLSSAGWPVSTLQIAEVRLNMSEEAGRLRSQAGEAYAEYMLQPRNTGHFEARLAQQEPRLSLGLFGWHASLVMEIAGSLWRALASANMDVRGLFFGAYYPASSLHRLREVLPEGSGSRAIAGFYRAWIDGFLDEHEAWRQDDSTIQGLGVLADLYLESMIAHKGLDVLVCITPLWFCVALAMATDQQLPIIVYFDDLPDQLPPKDFQGIVRWFRKAAAPYDPHSSDSEDSSLFALLAPSPLVAALTERLLGLRPPVAAWACWYLAESIAWDAPLAQEVLLLRADLWFESAPGRTFFYVFQLFLAESGFPFTLVTMLPQKASDQSFSWDQLWDQALRRSRAAIFMPDDMMKMIFWEAVSTGLPVWTPAQEYLARMLPFFGYYHFAAKHLPDEVREAAEEWGRHFPAEPFGLSVARDYDSRSQEQRMRAQVHALFWAGMSDFVRYPHVQHFDSLPDLIAGILSCDLRRISQGLRAAHAERAATSATAWRAAFGRVLGSMSSNAVGDHEKRF